MSDDSGIETQVERTIEQQVEMINSIITIATEYAIEYGVTIITSIIVLLIGLRVAGWLAGKAQSTAEKRKLDITLAKFIGNVVRILLLGIVIIVTLANFGITIAPFVALAGAAAFGATMAIQGPLSNYGAGLSIILSRPFIVGDTIWVGEVFGVVKEVKLAQTVLEGEDGETISIPNKEIVGQVITNSQKNRIVETSVSVSADTDIQQAIQLVKDAYAQSSVLQESGLKAQVGIHDFQVGGIVLGLRYWVPSETYFRDRCSVNEAVLAALTSNGVRLMRLPSVELGGLS